MTSITTYTEIKPTYLCIKQHSITKKKYFCKTTRLDPIKYKGSGPYWLRHINKHGKQFVETIWLSDLYYDTSIVEHALHFSAENNIVESDDWANFIPENGLDGFIPGGKHSAETRTKLSKSNTGRTHSPKSRANMAASRIGKKHSAETRAKQSVAKKGKKQSEEHIANRAATRIGKKASDETKAKQSASHTGKKIGPQSAEHKANRSASSMGKKRGPQSAEHKANRSAKFFSIIDTKRTYNKNSISRYFPELKQYF